MSLIVKSLIFFWSLFLILTIIFIFLIKSEIKFLNLVNYFILQEVLGLFFLFLKNIILQFLVILIKVGVRPLHFWIFSILRGLRISLIYWFLTFQKLVYFSVLVDWGFSLFFFLFFGIFICFIQVLFLFDFLKIFLINLTERINWVLAFFLISFFESIIFIIYYLGIFTILLKNNLKTLNINWIFILFLLNLPLSFNFFVKVFILSNLILNNYLLFFFFLFFMVMRVMGLIKILIGLNFILIFKNYLNKNFYLIVFQFLILFYCFSKIYIILSW